MTLSPKLKGYATLLAVFLLGGVVGAGVTHARAQHRLLHGGDRGESFEHRRVEAMTRRLDLDAAQQQKVSQVFEKYSAERTRMIREVMDGCGAPLRAQKEQMDAELRALLRPDQQAAFDALVKEQNERFSGRHH